MNERKSSRIARGVSRFLIVGLPMKSYSWHGVSPHVAWSPRDQKNFPQDAHWTRRKPWARNSSTSYSLSGIPFASLGRDIKVSGWSARRRCRMGELALDEGVHGVRELLLGTARDRGPRRGVMASALPTESFR